MATQSLTDEIGVLAAHLDSATQRLLACIREFDAANGWHEQGAISCAHWLAWRIGLDAATARERVRVARALGGLPKIDAALARGELSYAKVRALTRVATPEMEDRLLDLARHGTAAQLERICRGYRVVARAMTDEGALPEERIVRERPLPGGMVKLELVLTPDEAALVMKAIEKARDMLRDERRTPVAETATTSEAAPAGATFADSRPLAATASERQLASDGAPEVSRVDGALFLAERFLSPGPDRLPASGAERYQVLVHVDQDVLAEDGRLVATLDDGTRVSAESLRRLACDAGLIPALTGPGHDRDAVTACGSLDLGRRTRSISPALRRALWTRDRGCRFPGCPHTRFLHGHHIQHWLHGGATRLENLLLLCPRHHALVHEGNWTVTPTATGFDFHAPHGAALAAVPHQEHVDDARAALAAWSKERNIDIDETTNFPAWDGSSPDYDTAVTCLLD